MTGAPQDPMGIIRTGSTKPFICRFTHYKGRCRMTAHVCTICKAQMRAHWRGNSKTPTVLHCSECSEHQVPEKPVRDNR